MRTVPFETLFREPQKNGLTRPKAVRGCGTKMVNMRELFGNDRLKNADMDRVPVAEHEQRFLLEPYDLLFARQSLVRDGAGKCVLFVDDAEPTTFESHIIRVRLDRTQADPTFYYYWFRSPSGRDVVDTIIHQVAAAGIRGSDLARLPVPHPPAGVQRAIARILGALDDKIELNRRTNETLETMARAIFQSWFVDFDPVRAKMEGRQPEGMDAETARLFPARIDDAHGQPLPKSWTIATLGDLISVLETGSRPKGGVAGLTEGIPSIGAESIVGLARFDFSKTKYVSVEFFSTIAKGKICSRDVLIYKDGGRPGEFRPHVSMFGDGFPFHECAINEHVYRVRGVDGVPQTWLYFALSHDDTLEEMQRKGTGVAVPGLNSTAARSVRLTFPGHGLVARFDQIAEPLVARTLRNASQSRDLATLRDTLLPKLLSGDLRVPEAERAVEAAL